mmetsp:Transcript_5260/g.13255  ORF Transcript_5260/g.13255 Transcript_5260/m.13255 type:complete len:136 (-) Transcript_5260:2030-2437(-)
MDPFHLLSKQQEDQYADADEEGNSHHSSSSSSGFDDDDPRLQSLFATEPYPRPSKAAAAAAAPTAAQSSSPFMIDQNALMDCFEWTVSQYPLTEEDLGFWVAPNESMPMGTKTTKKTLVSKSSCKIKLTSGSRCR